MIQSAKKRFVAIFRSLVCWIDLIMHIVIELNVFQHSATSPGREGPFKNHKNPFLNDPKCKKRFLAIFRSLVCWIDLILHIVIVLNVSQHMATSPGHEGSFKNHKNVFLNDPVKYRPFSSVWLIGST